MPHSAGTQIIKAPGRGATGPGGGRPRPSPSSSPGLGGWQPPDLAQIVSMCTTIRYVRKTGSDANGGTNPSTDAWLTINHAVQTATAGTVIYVGAGTYREEITLANSGTPGSFIALVGDTDGSKTGDAGMVCLSHWLTDDKSGVGGNALVSMNGKSCWFFSGIYFANADQYTIDAGSGTSQRIVFRDCAFMYAYGTSGHALANIAPTAAAPLYWLIDRCFQLGPFHNTPGWSFSLPNSPGQIEYDIQVTFSNNVFIGSTTPIGCQTGSGQTSGGGIKVYNNSFIGCAAMDMQNSSTSTRYPHRIMGNLILTPNNGFCIVASGGYGTSAVEDYNMMFGRGVPGANNGVVGPHSRLNSYNPMIHFGLERLWGGMIRPLGEPLAGSPLAGFLGGGYPVDAGQLDARLGPRATVTAQRAIGAFQRGNNLGQETSVVHSGANAISITGPGFQDFQVPVASGAITLSIYCQYDSNYAGPPVEAQVLPNQAIGVGAARVEFPSAQSGVWQQAVIPISPSSNGVVTVRFISSDTSGISKVAFDSFAAA